MISSVDICTLNKANLMSLSYKKMAALHFTTIPFEPDTADYT